MSWLHGPKLFELGYACSLFGVVIGLIRGRGDYINYLLSPITAVVSMIAGVLLWCLLIVWMTTPQQESPLVQSLALGFLFLFGIGVGRFATRSGSGPRHKRGTMIDRTAATVTHRVKNGVRKLSGALTFAGVSLSDLDETKHFKLIGTTGTGKSTAIRELLTGALERGDRAVIADPDGSYSDVFYDPTRGDVILNPFDRRAARWDLFAEVQEYYDADQLARSLVPDTEGTEKSWRNYARIFLTSLVRQLHRVKHNDPAELYQLISTTPADDLRDLLADTPAGPYLAQDNGKFFAAVRAVANTHLSALEVVAGQTTGAALSVRRWVNTPPGQAGVLFLPYHANQIATLRSLISTWMRLAIFEMMSPSNGVGRELNPNGVGSTLTGNGTPQRLWFVVDELDAIGQIDGLKDALARLRKFGGRCVLGFQSIAQVSSTYGHGEAQTIVENCGNTLILRCSASEGGGTARFASKLIGEREIIRENVTRNDGGGIFGGSKASTSTSLQHVMESAVLPSEIEQLPDLQGYVKVASQPEWRRVKLIAPT